MKILLIDYISALGHKNFNKIHVNSLLEMGHELFLVGRSGQFDINASQRASIIEIPDWCYKMRAIPSLSFRLQGIASLIWIKSHVKFYLFDYVIVLTYDVMSLIVFRIKNKVLLINHNNVDQLNNSVKLFLTSHLPSNYTHVALNKYMMGRLKTLLPQKKVIYVPHGYLEPSISCRKPANIKEEKFIFCPVNRNFDANIINDLLLSEAFCDYLVENSIYLFIKPQLYKNPEGNIKVIESLDDEEYNYMLYKALAVLLPYGGEFKYRCSGILFECVARNTPIIATNIKALNIYKDKIDIHFFKTTNELLEIIKIIQVSAKENYDKKQFQPFAYWKEIIR